MGKFLLKLIKNLGCIYKVYTYAEKFQWGFIQSKIEYHPKMETKGLPLAVPLEVSSGIEDILSLSTLCQIPRKCPASTQGDVPQFSTSLVLSCLAGTFPLEAFQKVM